MGMFDQVIIEYDKIKEDISKYNYGYEFNTKSLENCMFKYTINKDGRLILHKTIYENVPDEQRPFYGTNEWPKFSFIGSIKEVDVGLEDTNYHGWINIYSAREISSGLYLVLDIKFTDGVVNSYDIRTES